MDNKKPKNQHVRNLLDRQKNKRERKLANNPLVVSKEQGETSESRSPEKSKKELQDALKEKRKSLQVPASLHKKVKRLSVTDDITMYEVLEKSISLYEAHRRR